MTEFGCVCEDCLTAFKTKVWQPPFLCPTCVYRDVQAARYLSWLRFRDQEVA